ncbi:hypothetical protein Nepgr_004914 [Nepenthes gracilis]|uniref:Uncharacterized protein n=1 Tax=Nepenthes gracilis TaxID=150966 RepID=A0AAD3XFT1_NEPGR|nr:hypothetical protein Nepgr_004914 [Nepenthes gracilis]
MATQQRGFCLTSSILVIFALSAVAIVYSQSTVETLPGFSGELPFKLETGYIGVGELDEIQLFYYFIESEREPVTDPLMLWLAGGPGCSGLSSILFEIGPLKIDVEAWNGSLPPLLLNPYSWTKVANILFIDQPVGTGFSYAISQSAYNTSDTLSVDQVYTFLRKWIAYHPRFISNPLYIGGNSYSGITVPILVQKILDGLEDKLQPEFNLQGYVLGNPLTDYYIDENSRIPFVHRVSLISDGLYQNATVHCNGDYVNLDFNKSLCITSMQTITTCLLQINLVQILEPQCAFSSKRRKEIVWDFRVEEAKATEFLLLATKLSPHSKLPELRCRSFGYMLSRKWANDVGVREALHVRQGTVSSWMRCVKSLPYYTKDVSSTIAYHRNLSTTGLRALIFSGDHDISVPYIGTLKWIKSLGIPVSDQWRAWYIDGQVAGYAMKFINDEYHLAYATLKGSGNAAPEYTPNPALAMIGRFFAYYPL